MQAKMCAVDAFYKKDAALVHALNVHLEDSVFGPYDYVSEAVNQLGNLKKKGRRGRDGAGQDADDLEALLKAFAESRGSSLKAFLEWPKLMQLKQKRDSFSHPFVEAFLLRELELQNPDLVPVENALKLLLGKYLK